MVNRSFTNRGFLIGLLYYYLGKDIEAGNNLLIDTIHDPKQIIPFRMAPFVYIGTIATHFFGGSAGREGTALQMAGAIAYQFSKPFRLNSGERAILIIAAIAAGFVWFSVHLSRCYLWTGSISDRQNKIQCYLSCIFGCYYCRFGNQIIADTPYPLSYQHHS